MPSRNFETLWERDPMHDDSLPPELLALEEELAWRPTQEPDPGLRGRILAAAHRRSEVPAVPVSMVEFVVVTAAAVLLCANLSMSLANQTDFGMARNLDGGRLEATAQLMSEVLPGTPPGEAVREALFLQLGSPVASSRETLLIGGQRIQE
jgi:hypothetical protein